MARLPVAILAGGLATRLRPLTETVPKVLLEVAGEPFLGHQLRLLAASGIERAVLCVGHMGEVVREWAGDGSRFGLRVEYSFDGPGLQGTGGAVRNALPLLGDRFLVLYGDSYLPCDYAAVEEAFLASGKLGQMTVFLNEGQWDTSNIEYDGTRILAYEKVNRTPRMKYIDYGLGALKKEAFDGFSGGVLDLAAVYQRLLGAGELNGYEVKVRFYEIGSFTGLEELDQMLKDRISGKAARNDV